MIWSLYYDQVKSRSQTVEIVIALPSTVEIFQVPGIGHRGYRIMLISYGENVVCTSPCLPAAISQEKRRLAAVIFGSTASTASTLSTNVKAAGYRY